MKQSALYYNADDPSGVFPAVPVNRGIAEVLASLGKLQQAGLRVINTARMTDDDRTRDYFGVIVGPVTRKHYRVRVCFGRSGASFGRGVPALVVWNDDGLVEDVYPHENKEMRGQYITISDYFLHVGGLPQ
ncbi:hypothetical protein [Candidatus Binatus sp.]|uniref:hypothetical protein n=1 Tax=Candidatus Binatus sp. TaxID=2811406 RepID=UPI003CC3A148